MRFIAVILCLSVFIYGSIFAGEAEPPGVPSATVSINAAKPGVKVSPELWGIFYEEINHAGDGGIYAELVQNRGLEEQQPAGGCKIEGDQMVAPKGFKHKLRPELLAWSAVADGGAKATIALDDKEPLNEMTPHSLRLEVQELGARAGVANSGYWGMNIQQGESYELSFYARTVGDYAPVITAALESADGTKNLGKAEVSGVGGAWKRYACSLQASGTDPKGRLALTVSKPGTLWFDMVSLFPKKTFKNRPNGLREDIANHLVAMKPGFLRFPGGCVVEGVTLQNRIQWKRTIGDIARRPGRWDLWAYHNTEGLGFHEYLQMAEDLGSELMYVFNAGLSCQFRKAEIVTDPQELQAYVQDTLDALEYAMGPADSKWGAERVKNGHAAPFKIKYVEIGNENWGEEYFKNYKVFYEAIKAKYPQIITIADYRAIPNAVTEIIDEHYYVDPPRFFNDAYRYDSYNRTGPKIYVGEYAVNSKVGAGNLLGAISEAAFMLGMERNSDVVIMASYAPLFENVNDRKWPVNLIRFDSSRCCGRSSYHVQVMFNAHRPDVTLPTELEVAPASVPAGKEPVAKSGGGIGVGTWDTQAEYKDIKVTQGDKTLFASDFSKGTEGWKLSGSSWKVQDGALRQTGNGNGDRATTCDVNWTDYTYTLKARKTGGAEGFLIAFHVQDEKNLVWWNIGGWGNKRHGIEQHKDGGKHPLGNSVDGSIETGKWYDIKVDVKAGKAECSIDGKVVQTVNLVAQSSRQRFYALGGKDEKTGQIIIKAVNGTAGAVETTFKISGAEKISPKARVITLSGQPTDENSLDEPTKVAPVESSFDGAGAEFKYSVKPYSLTIFRLDTK
ncbi:MAG TPA: alpha-L-arabinofuranosidase C-terminal domain-containing protein [Planctomycetota bacterium]|jgi:alpha-L-arabinofuranosidase